MRIPAAPTPSPLAWRIIIASLLAMAVLTLARWPAPSAAPRSSIPQSAAPIAAQPAQAALPPLPDPAPKLALTAQAARTDNAGIPIADPVPVAALPFHFTGDDTARENAADCLAAAAFYEAGDEPSSERAVVQVVLNRVRHPAFPGSVCAVVFQGSERRTGCQFTFTCDGALARTPSPAALARARAVALAALAGAVDPRVGLATHYHADYVVPRWRDGLVKIAQQGAHLFYRWPGRWGSPEAFTRSSGAAIEAAVPAIAFLSGRHDAPTAPVADHALPDVAAAMPPMQPPPAAAAIPALEIRLDPQAPPGSFALKALALCGKATDCRVTGRVVQDLAFLYIRHERGEGAYWDCKRFLRAERVQCLPEGTALQRLLASA